MKNAWTCDVLKEITSLVQPNPNLTAHNSHINQHTSIMHETLWKCKWNAMHDHIASNKQHPTQKFHKNLKSFQKPQKSHKTPKT